jgi:hypothetical protein
MKRNVIILTSGLSGSSVLTGLIARAGYWTGDTHKKSDYDTFENKELIQLNLSLFERAAFTGNYLVEFSPEAVDRIAGLNPTQAEDYSSFVASCERHRPWVWKDPRLWMTIRFWARLLDLEDCRFILLTRSFTQGWLSQILRRQIVGYQYSRIYEARVQRSILEFFAQYHVPYLQLRYEDLILRPAVTIQQLNRSLETELTVADLEQVYHKPLYKSPRTSWKNHLKALAIYAKNYSERVDLRRTEEKSLP